MKKTKNLLLQALVLIFCCFTASLTAQQLYQNEIQTYLDANQSKWNLSPKDISDWVISDQYLDKQTNLNHTYLQQRVHGINILNAVSSVTLRNGSVLNCGNSFRSGVENKINTTTPSLSAETALTKAAGYLDLTIKGTPVLKEQNGETFKYIFNDCGISRKDINVQMMFFETEGILRLAYEVKINMIGEDHIWQMYIDAANGNLIDKTDKVIHCDFGHGENVFGKQHNHDITDSALDNKNGFSNGYRVFPFPIEAPSFGARQLLINPADAIASPFGWHDTNGAAGAEYTITRGNNVYAYEDRADANTPGYSPDGGASLAFDFPLNLAQAPLANQDAIITNLFYVNNYVHDVLYHNGFDEASGNFQDNTYGNNGAGSDYVLAEAQDGGGTNNANFATDNDGINGVMQMYLWSGGTGNPASLVTPGGTYSAVEGGFGPGIAAPITGAMILATDGTAPVNDICEPVTNNIAGKIAVIDRGVCNFILKVQAAEAAGAIAVVICNNVAGAPFSMGGTGNTTIPAVMISQADCNALKIQLQAGTINGTLNPPAGGSNVDLDGSLDNGIVAHEYGHGLSIRLTGGPNNSNCLNNGEQGGEGWSDWLAMVLTIEPGDVGTTGRGMGTYAFGEPTTGAGIRRFPYSTDMAINPQTYGDLAASTEVHDIGEIWAVTLWDLTWALIDAEGFDPNIATGTGGNNTAIKLILEGMKQQPCGPGYLDGRDAILAADDALYGGSHRCLIWEAFARRGMGFDAIQGSNDAGDETEGFALPSFCQIPVTTPTAMFTANATSSCNATFYFTDQSTNIPQSWSWNFGDGSALSTAMNPSHTYTNTGTYTVTLTVTNTLGSNTHTLTVTYAPLATPTVTGNTSICAGNTTTLTAAVSGANTATWSVGTNVVGTGASFTTPALTANTTYLVRQVEDKPIQHLGPVDNTFAGGGNHNTTFEGKELFTAFVPFTLKSVYVYATGAGNRDIRLYDNAGTAIQTVTVNVPNGGSRITLNMNIPVAGDYSIGCGPNANLYRNNAGATYPYTLNGIASITASNATGSPATFFYYFYDWEVQETPCQSPPVTVNVNVVPGPVGNFTFNSVVNQLSVPFTDNSTGNPTSWSWNFGDGSAVSTQQNPTHTFPAPGAYTVTLTVSNGSCSNTVTNQVVLVVDGVNNLSEAFGLSVFPNPTNNVLNLQLDRVLTGMVNIDLIASDGRIVRRFAFENPGQLISLGLGEFPQGAYLLRLQNGQGTVSKMVTILD